MMMTEHPDLQMALRTPAMKTLMNRMEKCTKTLPGISPEQIGRYWRDNMRKSALGRGMTAAEIPSTWVLAPPPHWTKSDYIRAILLRCGLLPTMSTPWNQRECRNPSCATSESLYHILQRCPITHYARINRHDHVVKQISTYARGGPPSELTRASPSTVLNPTIKTSHTTYKPDIICKKNDKSYVIEVSVAYESDTNSLLKSYAYKYDKYNQPDLKDKVNKMYGTNETVILPFIVGARGSWLPSNDAVTHLLDLPRFLKTSICRDTLQWGSSIHRTYNATVWRLTTGGSRLAVERLSTYHNPRPPDTTP